MTGDLPSRIRRRMAQITRLRPNPDSGPPRSVIIGLGAQKAATTWLATELAQSPQIVLHRKEYHYWDSVRSPFFANASWSDGVSRRGVFRRRSRSFKIDPYNHDAYLGRLFEATGPQRCALDITPAYALCGAATFAEIKAIHPDVRFLFVLRDPVDRLWSGIRHAVKHALSTGATGIDVERLFLDAVRDPMHPAHRRSSYQMTLANIDRAGLNTLILFFDDVFSVATHEKIARFLDLPLRPFRPDAPRNVGVRIAPLSQAALVEATEAFGDTYAAIRARFGDRVPPGWRG
jgi:hypothetical protein